MCIKVRIELQIEIYSTSLKCSW